MHLNRSRKTLLIAILAAGDARRFGHAKLLSRVNGKTLLQHTQKRLGHALPTTQTLVVTGKQHRRLARIHRHTCTRFVRNSDWRQGLGSSLKCAVRYANEYQAEALLVVLADQVAVPSHHFVRLLRTLRRAKHSIAATRYQRALGPPVVFSAEHFPELLEDASHVGAKKLIKRHSARRAVVSCRRALDIDTQRDLKRWRATQSSHTNSQ